MALSQVKITVQDGGLGQVSGDGEQNCIHIDCSTNAVPNQLYTFSSLSNVKSVLGLGEGSDNVGYALQQSQGLVSALFLEPTVAGALGAVSHIGTGSGTITLSAAPDQSILLTVASTGTNGIATMTATIGSGSVSQPFLVPAVADGYTKRVLGSYCSPSYAFGTYTKGDTYTISTLGVVTATGTSPTVTQTSQPLQSFVGSLTITSPGTTGTAKAIYSLDGYNFSPQFVLSSTYAIPGSGVVLAASGTFALNDVYSFNTCGPTFSDANLTLALAGLVDVTQEFEMIHCNNKPATLAAAATTAAVLDTGCQALLNAYAPCFASVNVPQNGSIAQSGGSVVVVSGITQAATATAFANDASVWVSPVCYNVVIPAPISGLSLLRNYSWVYMARECQISGATDAADVSLGGQTVIAVSDLESLDEGLSDSGFVTPTTIKRKSGIFVNQATTLSYKNNSDFSYITNRRVMNSAIKISYDVLVNYLNSKQLVDPKTGFIAQQAANTIENAVDTALASTLVQVADRQVVAATCTINRMNDILVSQTLEATIVITPYAYGREIELVIGFALQS